MANLICKHCGKTYNKSEAKDHKCKECENELNYLGTCGECLNFDEFYDGIGTCEYKFKTRRNVIGCINFL